MENRLQGLSIIICVAGEPSPPSVQGQRGMGKAYRLGLVKQDDGGMPILEYIIKYKTVSHELLIHFFIDVTNLEPIKSLIIFCQQLMWSENCCHLDSDSVRQSFL